MQCICCKLSRMGVVVFLAAAVTPLFAQFNIQSGGFTANNTCPGSSAPVNGCQVALNVDAAVTGTGALRLTPASPDKTGSAWFVTSQNVAAGFTSVFQFQLSGGTGDGIAFVIQNVPTSPLTAIGHISNEVSSGGALGYGDQDLSSNPRTGEGITNSLAIEFDTHANSWDQESANHVAVQSCGTGPNTSHHNVNCDGTQTGTPSNIAFAALGSPLFADGNRHTVTIDYHPPCGECSNLTIYVDGNKVLQTAVDLASIGLTSNKAYVGFTAGTGAAYNNQDILSWSFYSNAPTSTTLQGNGAVNTFTAANGDQVTVQYPADATFQFQTSDTSIVMTNTQILTSVADFDARLANTSFSGDHCIPRPETGGLCVINRSGCTLEPSGTPVLCPCTQAVVTNGGHLNTVACPADTTQPFTNSNGLIALDDIWGKNPPITFTNSDKLTMLTANDNQNDFVDIGTGQSPDPTISGGTNSRNSDYIGVDTGTPLSNLNDSIAPTTTLSLFPTGFTTGPITVALNAVDNPGGSGVQQIDYGTAPGTAVPSLSQHVAGASTSFQVTQATTVAYRARDVAGNAESVKTQLVGFFNFTGFFQPVDNLPTFNSMKTGAAVPVKFSLGGNQGLNIFAPGYPVSGQIACSASATVDVIEQTVTAGGSSLQFDPTSNQYTYVWKTNSAWSGTCRQLVVKLIDGTSHVANFQFK